MATKHAEMVQVNAHGGGLLAAWTLPNTRLCPGTCGACEGLCHRTGPFSSVTVTSGFYVPRALLCHLKSTYECIPSGIY